MNPLGRVITCLFHQIAVPPGSPAWGVNLLSYNMPRLNNYQRSVHNNFLENNT